VKVDGPELQIDPETAKFGYLYLHCEEIFALIAINSGDPASDAALSRTRFDYRNNSEFFP
jgi:hypothetical protein